MNFLSLLNYNVSLNSVHDLCSFSAYTVNAVTSSLVTLQFTINHVATSMDGNISKLSSPCDTWRIYPGLNIILKVNIEICDQNKPRPMSNKEYCVFEKSKQLQVIYDYLYLAKWYDYIYIYSRLNDNDCLKYLDYFVILK